MNFSIIISFNFELKYSTCRQRLRLNALCIWWLNHYPEKEGRKLCVERAQITCFAVLSSSGAGETESKNWNQKRKPETECFVKFSVPQGKKWPFSALRENFCSRITFNQSARRKVLFVPHSKPRIFPQTSKFPRAKPSAILRFSWKTSFLNSGTKLLKKQPNRGAKKKWS